MLRVGLTGGLGSGKSTVSGIFAKFGIHVLEADKIGRELMQPGQPLYQTILAHFGQYSDAPALTLADGQINRAALAQYVFTTGRLHDLTRMVHPSVVEEQERQMEAIFAVDPEAIAMVESALIFEADRGGTVPGLRRRFDKIILVTAPEAIRIERYVDRVRNNMSLTASEIQSIREDAQRRIAAQMTDAEKIPLSDYVLENFGPVEKLEAAVQHIVMELKPLSLKNEKSLDETKRSLLQQPDGRHAGSTPAN